MKSGLEKQILEYLEKAGKVKAKVIADALGAEKKDVNALLYGSLQNEVTQNSSYEWSIAASDRRSAPTTPEFANSDLARLSRYYLACIIHDEAGVSTFAKSKYGDPDYIELRALPESSNDFQDMDEVRKIAGRVRKEKARLGVYFGYPTALKLVKSKRSSWQGYMVEPIFLFPIQEAENGQLLPDLSFPTINHKCIRGFTNASPSELMEHIVQLEVELGLTDVDETPDIDELTLRLRSIRSEWPWVEEITPSNLPSEPGLSEAQQEGIYNRAILIVAEKSPFTAGLESELGLLGKMKSDRLIGSALGDWLSGRVLENSDSATEAEPLLEVLPMNTEQRVAVSKALTSSLTIIAGPPGTGKSQVVSNLLINAAWRGQKILFASKNNKAVDVVEARVNGLGSRPVLLRVGSNLYQNKLAEYLMALLAASATPEDKEIYEESLERHISLIDESESLNARSEKLVAARNTVDQLDRKLDRIREEIGTVRIHELAQIDLNDQRQSLAQLSQSLDNALIEKQGLVDRMFWKWRREARLNALQQTGGQLKSDAAVFGLSPPRETLFEEAIPAWRDFHRNWNEQLSIATQVQIYFDQLKILQRLPTLEAISASQAKVTASMSDNADKLWTSWLRLQPSRLSADDRQLLNKYNATLKMMIDGASDERDGRKIASQYRLLLSKVNHLLSCWAVTSLSVKGKLPFESGFFDLVVFDESSQCDIASALPLLFRAKRAVVIGDPMQLSHISGLRRGQDQQLLDKFGLIESFPHWAYSYNSLFDLAAGLVSGSNIVSLRDHHRSHADIIEFSNREFYEGKLRVATRYSNLRRPLPDAPGVKWIDVKGAATRPSTGGAENITEAKATAAVLRRLVIDRNYEGSIGVVSPFRAQANIIRQCINDDAELADRLLSLGFLVDTVHKFQGDERDVMIFSPVISDDTPQGAVAFLRNNGNLFNVAITRARSQLLVVGDRSACAACEISYLSRFAEYSVKLETRVRKEVESAIQDLGPSYPMVSNPEQVSDWERVFYDALYEAGIRAIPQYRVERFALDFAVFEGDRRLNIEVDGERYHRNWTGELCRRDQMRNQRLYELGWDVRRFWVYEIRDDLESCIAKIRAWLHASNKSAV